MHTGFVLCPVMTDERIPPTAKIPRIDCAAKLGENGIEFRKRDGDFLDIKFDKGVIEIPTTQVWDMT